MTAGSEATHTGFSAADWDRTYQSGRHEELWDTPWSSPELAGVLAVAELSQNAVALDVGCGTGGDLVLMSGVGLTVIGIDLSITALSIARERVGTAGAEADFVAGDILRLPFAPSSFDVATDRGCLHHLPDGVRRDYASELGRVLRAGALLVVRGMSEGKGKHPVTAEAVGRLFREPLFYVQSVVSFDMVGVHAHRSATLAAIRRLP